FHRAFVRLVRATEDFHQRALARAVFADQRMDFTRRDLEGNAPQRTSGAEAFSDVSQPQRGGAGGGHVYFRYLSSGGFTSSAISGELKFSFVTKPTPVSIIGSTFLPCSTATIVFTPR